jgi:hypothetical protein
LLPEIVEMLTCIKNCELGEGHNIMLRTMILKNHTRTFSFMEMKMPPMVLSERLRVKEARTRTLGVLVSC